MESDACASAPFVLNNQSVDPVPPRAARFIKPNRPFCRTALSRTSPAPYITLVDAGLSPPSQPSTPTSLAHGARTHPHIRGVLLPVARHTRGRLKYARRPHPTTNMPSSVFWRSGPPPLARDYSPISHLPPFLLENPPRCLTIASETLARAEGRQPLSPRHTTIYRWRSLRTAGEFPQTATARDSCIPMRGQ